MNYRFVQRGTGVCGSDPDKEIRWFMNKNFRLALLRDSHDQSTEKVIDFTRYDLEAQEPEDSEPGEPVCNWSLMNRINQKGNRPQDKPVSIEELNLYEQAMIKDYYSQLLKINFRHVQIIQPVNSGNSPRMLEL